MDAIFYSSPYFLDPHNVLMSRHLLHLTLRVSRVLLGLDWRSNSLSSEKGRVGLGGSGSIAITDSTQAE